MECYVACPSLSIEIIYCKAKNYGKNCHLTSFGSLFRLISVLGHIMFFNFLIRVS